MKNLIYLLLIGFTLLSCQAQQKKQNVEIVPPAEFAQKMADANGQIIDVRTPKEYNAGYIEGAVNMHIYDKDFEQRVDMLQKDEPVYVYCKVGGRSAEAVEILKAKGFTNIIELEGGMDAWQEANKPVKK
jgi:rhodanese-related sulfurtransferase